MQLGNVAAVTRLPERLLVAVSQRFNDHGEGWRLLPAAGIVEMVARKRRRPILQGTDEMPICDSLLSIVVRHITDTKAIDRSGDNHRAIAKRERTFDPDTQFATVSLKLPRVDSTRR